MWVLILLLNTACLIYQVYTHNWPFVVIAGVGTAISLIGLSHEL